MELHQVELRYSALRKRTQRKEQQLVASLAEHGQMLPVVVIAASEPERFVLIDGYKRVRALKRLGRDTARATVWDLGEADALVLERLMRASEADSPIEQGWLLAELRSSFGLSLEELARRFDKSKSWVSRRLALVGELPAGVQTHVQQGDTRVTDPAHRPARGEGFKSRAFKPVEEQRLAELAPELAEYVAALKARPGGATRQLRTLLRLVLDYPREPLVKAIQTAAEYHLYDLARVERMLLRSLGRDYFLLPAPDTEEPDEG